jgi:hypothetical protein
MLFHTFRISSSSSHKGSFLRQVRYPRNYLEGLNRATLSPAASYVEHPQGAWLNRRCDPAWGQCPPVRWQDRLPHQEAIV